MTEWVALLQDPLPLRRGYMTDLPSKNRSRENFRVGSGRSQTRTRRHHRTDLRKPGLYEIELNQKFNPGNKGLFEPHGPSESDSRARRTRRSWGRVWTRSGPGPAWWPMRRCLSPSPPPPPSHPLSQAQRLSRSLMRSSSAVPVSLSAAVSVGVALRIFLRLCLCGRLALRRRRSALRRGWGACCSGPLVPGGIAGR